MVLSRPARTHVLPAPQSPDGLTIAPIRRSAESQSATAFMPDNGQVERMNRTIKEATVKRFHYESNEQLRKHLADFIAAHNFGRRRKTNRKSVVKGKSVSVRVDLGGRGSVKINHKLQAMRVTETL